MRIGKVGMEGAVSAFAFVTLFAASPACAERPGMSTAIVQDRARLEISSLSNRPDLVSGGDVLVEIALPTGTNAESIAISVNGNQTSLRPAQRKSGSIVALVDGLDDGPNEIVATTETGETAKITITNHPIGGPVISGPQVQPWRCDTDRAGLGPATDAQCNAPTKYSFVYKHAVTGVFRPYIPDDPPASYFVAPTTTDQGKTVPFIVRIETGTINRGIYDIAVLFDSSTREHGWNGKLAWRFGCSASAGRMQGKHRGCYFFDRGETEVLDEYALSRGFMVGASTQTNLGNNANTVVHAETLMMVKEHIVESYGPIRYTIGQGGSGGSMSQHAIATQYPGLVEGLRPTASFPDLWSVIAVNGLDCALLNRYFDETAPELWPDVAQRNAVYGYGSDRPEDSGADFCHGKGGGSGLPMLWDPVIGGNGGEKLEEPCVAPSLLYDPKRNPGGVRCSIQDYMINVFGQRPPTVWGDVEKKIGRGFANRFLDRVGVQYGLRAFEAGAITAEQFVDLNERIGGWDIDTRWQPERTTGDRFAIEQMYRNGLIVDGRLLAKVAIIDYRRTTRADIHSNRQAAFVRERMLRSNGTAASRAEWIEPNPSPAKAEIDDGSRGSAAVDEKLTLRVLDEWLSRIEADRSDLAIEQKIVRNKPPEAADGCFEGGQRIGAKACASYELDSDPLLVAGMPAARDILKCQLKPLRRADYRASFTTAQWDRLEQTFASGVCDWSKPGVGQQSNIPWLTYEKGAPGKPFADEQQVRKFGDQMSRRIGGQNAGQR